MSLNRINVNYLARVEGEGGLDVTLSDGKVTKLEFRIFEPPRFFEAFLEGRTFMELPDFVPRICGICPVAYQMSAIHATEDAFGVQIHPTIRALRRLFYCGEWIESHTLHVYLLAAPDFLGYESGLAMAKDHPDLVKMGLSMKRTGNDLVALLAGREIHPIGVRPGGFTRSFTKDELTRIYGRLRQGKEDALKTIAWVAGLDLPDLSRDTEFVSLSHPDEYPMNEGRIVSNKGLDISVDEYDNYFAEDQVPYSTALRGTLRGKGAYFVGPLARVNLNFDKLTDDTKAAAAKFGAKFPSSNSFMSIMARALEIHHAFDEAMQIIDAYEPPPGAFVDVQPKESSGQAATEAPRGILYHRYAFDAKGKIRKARIVPPTSQNQRQIEEDLLDFIPTVVDLPQEEATLKCEMVIRNYDPCISCSTHFLKLKINRE